MELRYINGETRLIMVDRESTYADLVACVKNVFAVKDNFCIKNKLHGEKPDCLITISLDEDFLNMLTEHERAVGSSSPVRIHRSMSVRWDHHHIHLFILQDESSLLTGVMLGAMKAKMNVAEGNECGFVGDSVKSTRCRRWRNRHRAKEKDIKTHVPHRTRLTSTTFAS